MPAQRCYYAILSIERTASAEEVKRSYRRLAMKHHPDRNPGDPKAEEEFKACAEAYEVLSDSERRARYDQHGRAGLRQTPGHDFHSMHSEDIFSMFADIFGGQGPRGRRAGSRGGARRGFDLETTIEVTLEDVLRGGEVEVSFRRVDVCGVCSGTGAKVGSKPIHCPTCGGQGQVVQAGLGGMFRMVTTCPNCSGRGSVIADKCHECHAAGRLTKRRTLSIRIPPGISEGQVIRLAGEGEPPPPEQSPAGEGARGDLHVVVHVAEHDEYERAEDDLVCARTIAFSQAALGGSIRVGTLDGESQLEIPAGTKHGELLRLPEKGLPNLRSGKRGDLLVSVEIRVPKKLTERQSELLRELAKIDDVEVVTEGKGVWKQFKKKFGA